jgi:hypothetical protein
MEILLLKTSKSGRIAPVGLLLSYMGRFGGWRIDLAKALHRLAAFISQKLSSLITSNVPSEIEHLYTTEWSP